MKLRSNAGCQTARGCPALSTFLPKDHTSCRAGKHRSRASLGRFEIRCSPKAPATRSPAGDPLFLPLLAQGCEVAEKGCARPKSRSSDDADLVLPVQSGQFHEANSENAWRGLRTVGRSIPLGLAFGFQFCFSTISPGDFC